MQQHCSSQRPFAGIVRRDGTRSSGACAHIQPVAPRIDAGAQLRLARRPSASSSSSSHAPAAPGATPPAPARAGPPTAPRCAGCRAGRSPPAAPRGSASSARAAVEGQQRRAAGTASPSLLPAGGGTGCLPAAAPADRCPACWPRRPAPRRRCARSPPAPAHQRQHLRRDALAARRDRRCGGTCTSRGLAASALRRPARPASARRTARARRRASPAARRRSISLHRQQRVAAQLEEVVVPAHPLDAQQLRPDRGQRLLDLALRRLVAALHVRPSPSGAGSALRSSLPLGVSGSASSCTKAAGTMYSGSARARCARSASASAALASPTTVGHQALVARRVLARQHHRLAHAGRCSSRASISPELDAEAADLHLEVVAAEELDVAVGQPAPEVAGLVHPRAGLACERIGTKRSASAPAGSGSRAPRRRRRCRSRRPRPPAPAGRGRRGCRSACWRSAGRCAARARIRRPRTPSSVAQTVVSVGP